MEGQTIEQTPRPRALIQNYMDWAQLGKPALWRYAIVLVVGITLSLFVLPLLFDIFLVTQKVVEISQQTIMVFSLLPGVLLIFILVWLVLGRPAWSVALPSWPPSGRSLVAGFVIGLLVSILPPPFVTIHYDGIDRLRTAGAAFVFTTVAGLLVQTGAEELLFRGLIQQTAYRLWEQVWFAVLLQALIFGYLHIDNIAQYSGSWLAMGPYFITALTWGWIAWRTGSLLVPWMLHFTNNASTALLLGAKGDVLHSVGPFSVEPPSIGIAVVITAIQAALWIALVEIYSRRNSRSQMLA